MVITLHGPDSFRRLDKRRSLVSEFSKKHTSLGIEYFDLERDGDFLSLSEFLKSQSMFSSAKLGILEHAFDLATKPYLNLLLQSVEAPGVALILESDTKPTKAFQFLIPKSKANKKILIQEFEYLSGASWNSYVADLAKARGISLAPEATSLLGAVYGKNTWALVTELDKLSLSGKKVISKIDVESLALEISPNFWEMIGGLKNASVSIRLKTLNKLLSQNEPAAKIFNILMYQWPDKLQDFARYDILIKSGKCDYEEALADVLL